MFSWIFKNCSTIDNLSTKLAGKYFPKISTRNNLQKIHKRRFLSLVLEKNAICLEFSNTLWSEEFLKGQKGEEGLKNLINFLIWNFTLNRINK